MSRTIVPAEVFDPATAVLFGSRCGTCAAVHFPPLEGCPDCFAPTAERVALSGEGLVRSFTVVHLGFPGFPTGYPLVEVEFPEGILVVGQLVGVDDPAALEIGMPVRVDAGPVRTDPQGEALDGYRFVPGGLT